MRIASAVLVLVAMVGVADAKRPARETTGPDPNDPLYLALKHAADNHVAIYSYHVKYAGNTEGFTAPIIETGDGGYLIVGTKTDIPAGGKYEVGKSRPVAIKLDKSGQVEWEKEFRKKGFLDHEGGSGIESDGGYIIYVQSYVHPARGSVARLLKLDAKGEVVWERQLRGNGGPKTPHPQTFRLTKKGSIVMTGHIYLDKREYEYAWDGEVDKKGKLVVDKVGKGDPYNLRKR